jgi:hypothetical protein
MAAAPLPDADPPHPAAAAGDMLVVYGSPPGDVHPAAQLVSPAAANAGDEKRAGSRRRKHSASRDRAIWHLATASEAHVRDVGSDGEDHTEEEKAAKRQRRTRKKKAKAASAPRQRRATVAANSRATAATARTVAPPPSATLSEITTCGTIAEAALLYMRSLEVDMDRKARAFNVLVQAVTGSHVALVKSFSK